MRWRATVVLPEPAPPWITTMPLPGWVISSNCSLSISAAISGSALSARATPWCTPSVPLAPPAVALLVAVVDPRHRRVAPVDDLHVGLAVDEAALADQHVLGLVGLAQPDMREVRRGDVDRQLLATADPGAQ